MNEKRRDQFMWYLGLAIDQIQKKVPGVTTAEITSAACRFAAGAGELVDPDPAVGMAFAIDEFMAKMVEVGDRTGIKPNNVLELYRKRDGN